MNLLGFAAASFSALAPGGGSELDPATIAASEAWCGQWLHPGQGTRERDTRHVILPRAGSCATQAATEIGTHPDHIRALIDFGAVYAGPHWKALRRLRGWVIRVWQIAERFCLGLAREPSGPR